MYSVIIDINMYNNWPKKENPMYMLYVVNDIIFVQNTIQNSHDNGL
jgi:hypothetical protein